MSCRDRIGSRHPCLASIARSAAGRPYSVASRHHGRHFAPISRAWSFERVKNRLSEYSTPAPGRTVGSQSFEFFKMRLAGTRSCEETGSVVPHLTKLV